MSPGSWQTLEMPSASGRVMRKLGMSREGLLRQYVCNRGVFEDLCLHSLLRSEFETIRM